MILRLTDDASSIGIRIKGWEKYLTYWQGLALCISPGQSGCSPCCNTGGSPWILHGCWPGHRTGVDLMNPSKPDFPTFFIQADGVDDNLVIFNLPDRWRKEMPYGRYSGAIRYQTQQALYRPINALVNLGATPVPEDPGCYDYNPPACVTMQTRLKPCVLAEFDIDYGPRCSQFIIDRVDVELENGQ